MIRLLYISQGVEGMSDDVVHAILESASKNNPPRGITGVLVYAGRVWAQVLEGPDHHVLETYLKIVADKRHRDCRIVFVSPCGERIFNDISMAALDALPLELEHIADLDAHRKESVSPDAFKALMGLFFTRLTPVT
jgi:hypothetical protein